MPTPLWHRCRYPGPEHRVITSLLCLLLLLPLNHAFAQQGGRSLRWSAVDVTAHLDADGRLEITERQTIVLSGNWNGPERAFDVANGQTHHLRRLARLDRATGAEHVLTEGNLSRVDEYRWFDGHVLRWRSRLPSAPAHRNDTLVYTLVHGYEGILVPRTAADGTGATEFVLDHDFAFRDRRENIERFTLRLTLDPAWAPPAGFSGEFAAGPLRPGMGYVVTLPLRFTRAGQPGGVVIGAGFAPRNAILAALVVATLLLFLRFIARENALGRFAPLPHRTEITREWLERHVLSVAPEVVGAAWDDTTAAPEVAATLARLVADGKLASDVESKAKWVFKSNVLHLRLLVPRDSLTGHDRALVDALFNRGSDRTSTDDVRKRYTATGFDPATLIGPSIRRLVEGGATTGRALKAPSAKPTLILLAVAATAFVVSAVQRRSDVSLMQVAVVATIWYVLTAIQARLWQTRVVRPAPHLLRVLIPVGVGLYFFGVVLRDQDNRVSALALAAVTLWVLALVTSVFNICATRHDAERIALRKRLAAARAYFQRELRKPSPALLDAWFPWIIGFGLGPHIDRWFRGFGGASPHTTMPLHHSSSGSGSGSAAGGGWSGFGGGGGFSGGGSSSSFAAAVGGMAAAVAAPSSSSSGGGGGGGGGGSSGGGGGGGW